MKENETFFIDVSEKICPMTTVYVRSKIDTMTSGQRLEIILRGSETKNNIEVAMRALGHKIISGFAIPDRPDFYCLTVLRC